MSERRDDLEPDDLLEELDSLRGLLDTKQAEPETGFTLAAGDDEMETDGPESIDDSEGMAALSGGDRDEELDLDALIAAGWDESDESGSEPSSTLDEDGLEDLPDDAPFDPYADETDSEAEPDSAAAIPDTADPTLPDDDDIPVLEEVVAQPPAPETGAAEEQYGFEQMASDDWAPLDADAAAAEPAGAEPGPRSAEPPPVDLEALVDARLEQRIAVLREELREQLLAELRRELADR